MIEIRRGRLEDHEAIAAIATDTFEWGDYVASVYPEWLEEADGEALVAVDENDQAIAVVHVRLLAPQEGWISGARVAGDHRRQGVGSLLNQAAQSWLQNRGAVVARLTTEEDNKAARSQVEKLGYRPVANFIHGHRSFPPLGVTNGRPRPALAERANGRPRPALAERFDLAPAAEAEPAFVVFSSGGLARSAHGLFASDGWNFRRLHHADLVSAARRRQLWTCPSGWVAIRPSEERMWVSLLVTSAEDSRGAIRALVDLGEEHGVESMELIVPRIGWLEEALASEWVMLAYPNVVYERPLP
ncbi:MAG: GNAT family N-acetyltransferase [Acidimicrobiia bacterium]|nr:GNAT family N-acetyltransferase [Actinomycetota bacterium]